MDNNSEDKRISELEATKSLHEQRIIDLEITKGVHGERLKNAENKLLRYDNLIWAILTAIVVGALVAVLI